MEQEKKRNVLVRFFGILQSLFLNGLVMLLPITLTIAIFHISFKLVKGWLEPLQQFRPQFLKDIPHSEILIIIATIFLVGMVLKIIVLRSIVHAVEDVIAKIPLVRPIYSGIRQLVQAFSAQNKVGFKKVVLIEFPRKHVYSIGFLTSEMPRQIAPNEQETFFSIFVPTTPNPTSGYFVMVAKEQITTIDLSHQEAMALIISGGIIQPKRFKKLP